MKSINNQTKNPFLRFMLFCWECLKAERFFERYEKCEHIQKLSTQIRNIYISPLPIKYIWVSPREVCVPEWCTLS